MRISYAAPRRRKKKGYFKLAKGGYAAKGNCWRQVRQNVEKALVYAYTGRKDRKNEYRSLWIMRINAACRELGMSYSRFMAGLKKANITLNHKMMAEMALKDQSSFKKLVTLAQKPA